MRIPQWSIKINLSNTINASTLLAMDVLVPDPSRSLGSLLTPPNITRNSLLPPKKTDVITAFTTSANCINSTVSGSAVSMTDDTTNPMYGSFSPVVNFPTSASSRRLHFSNTNTANPINLTNKIVSVSFRVIRGANSAGFVFAVRLYSTANPTSPGANYHTFDVVVDGAQKPIIGVGNEWLKVSIAISRFTAVGTGADLTACTFGGVEIACPALALPWQIALGNITTYDNYLNRASVVVMFDGLYRSQWDAASPIMKKYDIPATVYATNASLLLKNELAPVYNTTRIANVTASPTSPLIRITLASNSLFTTGKSVALAGIVGVTDNAAVLTGTTVYTLTKIDALTFDLVGSVFGGAFDVNSRAMANFSVTLVTNVDVNPVDGTSIRMTVADPGVYETSNVVTIGGVTGVSANRTTLITKIDGSNTTFAQTNSTFSGAYTGGGYVIYGINSGNTFMTAQQLGNLQDVNGWQVGTYTNKTNAQIDFVGMDKDAVARDFQNNQAYLGSRGFRGLQDCVYFNDTYSSDQHIYGYLKRNYRTVRQYLGAVPNFKNETLPIGDSQAIRSFGVFETTTTATVIGLIDAAIANKELLMIVFHEVDRRPSLFGNTSNYLVYDLDNFKTIIDYIGAKKAAGLLDSMTLENVLEIQNNRSV